MFRKLGSLIILFSLMLISVCFVTSCRDRSSDGMIVLTQVKMDQETAGFSFADDQALFSGAKIMMMDPMHVDRSALLLSDDFYSACSPVISFDAKKMIFSGQKSVNSVWQIFEMDLASLQYKQLTNSIDQLLMIPVIYLEKKLFTASLSPEKKDLKGMLFLSCILTEVKKNRSLLVRGLYKGTSVLHDGRIISMNRQLTPEPNKTNLVVMRPDGTKEMLFYKPEDGSQLMAKGKESETVRSIYLKRTKKGSANYLLSLITIRRKVKSSNQKRYLEIL